MKLVENTTNTDGLQQNNLEHKKIDDSIKTEPFNETVTQNSTEIGIKIESERKEKIIESSGSSKDETFKIYVNAHTASKPSVRFN